MYVTQDCKALHYTLIEYLNNYTTPTILVNNYPGSSL